ncbi:hypothetical protein XAUC_16460 [Xanthomonas citri pv. aurantifolii str. ICPB 10535]|nr:hypothetical protein XAUC_16460 [Xanthomonas citri pv. aurantifolii str. ICPB 10535]
MLVEHRVVGRLDPYFPAALADAPIAACIEGTAPERIPERAIRSRLARAGIDEHAVVLADDLLEPVAHHLQEILVGREHRAVQRELDDGHHLVDGVDAPLEIGCLAYLRSDVGGVLHHAIRLAGSIQQRVVGGIDPHLVPAFIQPAEAPGIEVAAPQPLPEVPIAFAVAICGRHEHAVVLADHLVQSIPHQGQEVRVRIQNAAVQVELDNRHHPVHRCDLVAQPATPEGEHASKQVR